MVGVKVSAKLVAVRVASHASSSTEAVRTDAHHEAGLGLGIQQSIIRRNFIALVFFVYVTRPVVVTAAVYDEQIVYYFMSPCKGVPAPFIST
jgi:hypothetical protein